MRKPTSIERAFELAKSGRWGAVDEIRRLLKQDGLDRRTLEGKALFNQLRLLVEAAKRKRPETIPGTTLNARNDE